MKRNEDPLYRAPDHLREQIKALQTRARRIRAAGYGDTLIAESNRLVAEDVEKQIDRLLAEEADLHLCPHCGRYKDADHAAACEEGKT